MADQQERIAPGEVVTFKSRRRGGCGRRRPPYSKVERDYGEFRRAAPRMLRELDDGRRADAARHARYGYTPYPIFWINLTQRVPHGRFKKSLESANVETISSATGRSGYWVVAGGGGHAGRLDRKIERRAALRGPTFVDAIASFSEADPSRKLGPSLVRHPIAGGFEPVDVEVWRLGDDALDAFVGQLRMMVADNGGWITDTYRTHDTFVAQIACDAALLSTVAALREVVRVDRPLWARTDDRSRRATGKIAAGTRATGTPGTPATGPWGAAVSLRQAGFRRPRARRRMRVRAGLCACDRALKGHEFLPCHPLRRRNAGRGSSETMTVSRPCAAARRTAAGLAARIEPAHPASGADGRRAIAPCIRAASAGRRRVALGR